MEINWLVPPSLYFLPTSHLFRYRLSYMALLCSTPPSLSHLLILSISSKAHLLLFSLTSPDQSSQLFPVFLILFTFVLNISAVLYSLPHIFFPISSVLPLPSHLSGGCRPAFCLKVTRSIWSCCRDKQFILRRGGGGGGSPDPGPLVPPDSVPCQGRCLLFIYI